MSHHFFHMIYEALETLGINKKETDLYTKLLALGAQPASILARRLSIPRSTAQFLAESLVQKGIASKQKTRNVIHYQPVDPEELPQMLKAKKERAVYEFGKKEKLVQEAAIALKKEVSSYVSHPIVSYYEGEEGLQTIYEDALTASESIRSLVNFEDRKKFLGEYFDTYYQRRKKAQIFMNAIYPDTDFGRQRKKMDEIDYRKSHLVDPKKYYWLPEMQIYDNKVTIACGSQRIGIIIESEEVTQAIKVLFDLAWEGLEKRDKE